MISSIEFFFFLFVLMVLLLWDNLMVYFFYFSVDSFFLLLAQNFWFYLLALSFELSLLTFSPNGRTKQTNQKSNTNEWAIPQMILLLILLQLNSNFHAYIVIFVCLVLNHYIWVLSPISIHRFFCFFCYYLFFVCFFNYFNCEFKTIVCTLWTHPSRHFHIPFWC